MPSDRCDPYAMTRDEYESLDVASQRHLLVMEYGDIGRQSHGHLADEDAQRLADSWNPAA